jgi:hypothetical protein
MGFLGLCGSLTAGFSRLFSGLIQADPIKFHKLHDSEMMLRFDDQIMRFYGERLSDTPRCREFRVPFNIIPS